MGRDVRIRGYFSEPKGIREQETFWGKTGVNRASPNVGPLEVFIMRPAATFVSSVYTIYLFTPWSRVLLEKLTGSQLVKKFPTFYGTLLVLIPPLPLGLPSGLFPLVFPTKTLYTLLLSHIVLISYVITQ